MYSVSKAADHTYSNPCFVTVVGGLCDDFVSGMHGLDAFQKPRRWTAQGTVQWLVGSLLNSSRPTVSRRLQCVFRF